MATALFMLGYSGVGKTRLAKAFIKSQIKMMRPRPWALLDKDTTSEVLGCAFMSALGLNPDDRDSPDYKEKVRDLEYKACLVIAREQLKLGINVVLPGPWTKELQNGDLFDPYKLGLPLETKIKVVYLESSLELRKQRIIERANPRDAWKIENWDTYSSGLNTPEAVSFQNIPVLNTSEGIDKDCIAKLIDICKQP